MQQRNSLIIIMFEFQKQSLANQLAIKTFNNQVSNKLMVIEKFAYEFNQLTVLKQTSNKSTIQLVKSIRKTIQQVQDIFEIIKAFLLQFKLELLNDLIHRSFQLLILCLKCISTKFIACLKQRKQNDLSESPNSLPAKSQTHDSSTRMSQLKTIEHCQFLIKNIQQEEQKLDWQRKQLQKQLSKQNNAAKIKPSDTVNQLQSLNKQIQKIISNTYKICGENVLSRYQEVTRKFLQLKKPEQIQSQFCVQFTQTIKEKFIKTIQKIAKEIYENIRFKQKQLIRVQILGQLPVKADGSTQTEPDGKTKQIQQLTRDKKLLSAEMQSMRKVNFNMNKQMEKMTDKIKQLNQQIRGMERKTEEVEQLLRKKVSENYIQKLQFQKQIMKKQQEIEKIALNQPHKVLDTYPEPNDLDSNLTFTKAKSQIQQQINVNQKIEEIDEPISIKSTKYKYPKERSNNSQFLQKQFRVKKKQNIALQKIQIALLGKLAEIHLLQEQDINLLSKEHDMKKLSRNIQMVLSKITQNFDNFRQSAMQRQKKLKDELLNFKIFQSQQKGNNFISQFTQTQPFNSNQSMQNKDQSLMGTKTKVTRLDQLKKEFIEKISKNKKNGGFIVNKSKLLPLSLNTRESLFNNKTVGNQISLEQLDYLKQNQNEDQNNIYKKEILFEPFKIAQAQKKPAKSKKSEHTIKKDRRPLKFQQSFPEHQTSKPIMEIQSYQTLRQVVAVIELIEARNDKNDHFLNSFLKSLIMELNKSRGKGAVENMLRSQLNELVPKLDRRDNKSNKPNYLNLQIPFFK